MAILFQLHRIPRCLDASQVPTLLSTIIDQDPFSVVQTILVLIFGRQEWFVDTLGYLSLGLESTLPLPQLIRQGIGFRCLYTELICAF
jgi:hypothetical protein